MKTPFWLGLIACVLAAGCDKPSGSAPTTTNSSSSGNPITAPVDYLGAIGKAQQNAVKTVDTVSLNQTVQMFQVDQGRNPTDLNELVEKKYIPRLPETPYGTKLAYDATTGKVTVVKQ
jgi:hypothetical protein